VYEAAEARQEGFHLRIRHLLEEVKDRLGVVEVEFLTPEETLEHPEESPCVECSWREVCFDSRRSEEWAAKKEKGKPITSVHTCLTCTLRSISIFTGSGEKGGQVPEACPRWNELSGSLLDCGACEAERSAIRRRHPVYKHQTEFLREVFDHIGKGPHDQLSIRRRVREMAEAASPLNAWGEDFNNPSPALQQAERVFQVVQYLAKTDSTIGDLVNEWQRNGVEVPDRWGFMLATWAEAIYFAIREHGNDADKVTHEFVLAYTQGPARRAWRELSLEERREQVTRWKEYIGHVLNVEDPDETPVQDAQDPDPGDQAQEAEAPAVPTGIQPDE